jgi:hypothetical protein
MLDTVRSNCYFHDTPQLGQKFLQPLQQVLQAQEDDVGGVLFRVECHGIGGLTSSFGTEMNKLSAT